MRIVKLFLWLFVIVVVIIGVFAWTLPADVAYRYGASRLAPFVLTGIRGTVWQGHADGVSVVGRDLGELNWRLRKIPLLRGAVAADIRVQGADVDVAAQLTRRRDASITAHDLRFSFPAQLLAPALDLGGLTLLGGITGIIDHATLTKTALSNVSGGARWSDAGVSGPANAKFSDLLVQFASQTDGSIAGTVRDDGKGDLAANGTFRARLGTFDVDVVLAARNNDAAVAEILHHVGELQADGSSKLEVHGQMLKLF